MMLVSKWIKSSEKPFGIHKILCDHVHIPVNFITCCLSLKCTEVLSIFIKLNLEGRKRTTFHSTILHTYQNIKPVKRGVYFEPQQDPRNTFHTMLQFHSEGFKIIRIQANKRKDILYHISILL